jgi:hypothetical protein
MNYQSPVQWLSDKILTIVSLDQRIKTEIHKLFLSVPLRKLIQEIANYIIKEAGLSIINLPGDGILNWHINPRKISELVSILSWNGKIDNPWKQISTDQKWQK